MIRFRNVGMRYGQGPEILRDVTFELLPGSFHFLTGRSGAGKSSLLQLLYLAQRPARGEIFLFDRDAQSIRHDELPMFRRRIGVVFQDFRLLSHLTVAENVAMPLRIAGQGAERIERSVKELLKWVTLEEKADSFPDALSGGEKQRAAIARAVVSKPELLLADEPTGNVDNNVGYRLLRLFEALHKAGTTVVVATHNEALLRRFSQPMLKVEDGKVAQLPAKAKV